MREQVRCFGEDGELLSLEEIRKGVLRMAIVQFDGNLVAACRAINLSRSTAYRMLKEERCLRLATAITPHSPPASRASAPPESWPSPRPA